MPYDPWTQGKQTDNPNPYAPPEPVGEVAAPVATAGGEMPSELLDELQRVANNREMHKRLRANSVGNLLFGAIAIAVGVPAMQRYPLNIVLVAIGMYLVVTGLWLLIRPSPIGVILAGIGLLLVGCWNLGIQILIVMHGHQVSGWGVYGLLQLAWGVQTISLFPRFSKMPRTNPSPDVLGRIDAIAKDIRKSSMSKNPELIEWQAVSFFGKQNWKGRLRESFAAFGNSKGHEVIFARPADVGFIPKKIAARGNATGTMQIVDRRFNVNLSADAFRRFQNWKQTQPPTETTT